MEEPAYAQTRSAIGGPRTSTRRMLRRSRQTQRKHLNTKPSDGHSRCSATSRDEDALLTMQLQFPRSQLSPKLYVTLPKVVRRAPAAAGSSIGSCLAGLAGSPEPEHTGPVDAARFLGAWRSSWP